TVSHALFDLAKILLVDRSAFFVDPDSIVAIDISDHVQHARFSAAPGRDAGERGEAAISAMGALRAERALHVGAPAKEEGFDKPALEVNVLAEFDAGRRATSFTLGAKQGDGYFARVDGVNATFLLSEASVRPLLDAIEKRGP
ncbi:MAG: hypothetical protein ACRELY_31875, partial [Polyangiaceae bacterium]